MAKTKKIRVYQLAERLHISYKEFQQRADALGMRFHSAQNSLPEEEALALLARMEKAVQDKLSFAPVAPIAASRTTEVPQPPPAPIFRPIPVRRPTHTSSQPAFRLHSSHAKYPQAHKTPMTAFRAANKAYLQQHRVGGR